MNTFLLYWNPHFSSYTVERFLSDMPQFEDFNWSIVEHENAHAGDRFFFIRCGYDKPTGIIGAGHFISEPYPDEDWSGQGREVYYMDMKFDSFVDPTSADVLSTETLPEINWQKGKSGTMISPEIAQKIAALWEKHIGNMSYNIGIPFF